MNDRQWEGVELWGNSGGRRICIAVSEFCSAPEPQTAPDQNHWSDIIITDALSEDFDKDDDGDACVGH